MVANHDPRNQGRVRVQYYRQEAGETAWVRLMSPHAGAYRGLLLPELGDEVAVMFEEGDPERPVVVGSAWNGVHPPPTSGFHAPGEINGQEFAGNNIKRIVTKSGHRITMVDTPGKETISFATPASNRLMMTERHRDTGRPAFVLETQGDLIFSAPQGRIHTQSALHSREVGIPKQLVDLEFRRVYPDGTPIANLPYTATLSDGSVLQGITDRTGAGRHGDVLPGGAHIVYEPNRNPAESTVKSIAHDDIAELFGLASGRGKGGT